MALFTIFFGSFSLSLLIRIIDELKDKEDDKIHFPSRCLPSGRVFYSDIKKLGILILLLFISLNIFIGSPFHYLGLLLTYFFLFHKWFFLPDKLRKNLIIVLITHNPIGFIIPFYFITLLNYHTGDQPITFQQLLLSISFWFPSLAWEVSRKIRSPQEESNYNTYSKKFGVFKSSLIPIISFGIQLFIFYYLFQNFFNNKIWITISFILFSLYSLTFILFSLNPSPSFSKYLRPLTEIYVFIINIILIVNGVLNWYL